MAPVSPFSVTSDRRELRGRQDAAEATSHRVAAQPPPDRWILPHARLLELRQPLLKRCRNILSLPAELVQLVDETGRALGGGVREREVLQQRYQPGERAVLFVRVRLRVVLGHRDAVPRVEREARRLAVDDKHLAHAAVERAEVLDVLAASVRRRVAVQPVPNEAARVEPLDHRVRRVHRLSPQHQLVVRREGRQEHIDARPLHVPPAVLPTPRGLDESAVEADDECRLLLPFDLRRHVGQQPFPRRLGVRLDDVVIDRVLPLLQLA
eukprot:CAMPEP_0182836244 /NCGR_PEP_ID=MMETSP0006_2-20121128/21986_1 /TAXON_ID=97485 /ORGANISM="Prymnesium parvum, Strain Texoma1" /LENGTH=266 /DNA_ID=CAMNT_0024964827 /DNA_START=240 /DNA_END=1037 /DNA_ORIENTATION=-